LIAYLAATYLPYSDQNFDFGSLGVSATLSRIAAAI